MTLILRPLTGPEELDLFTRFPYVLNTEIEGDLAAGRRRPGWLWVALRGDRLTARAAWWSRPGDAQPALMDVFDVDEPEDGVRLVRAALAELGLSPGYVRFVPPDWRGRDAPWRSALEKTGAVWCVASQIRGDAKRLWRTSETPARRGTDQRSRNENH